MRDEDSESLLKVPSQKVWARGLGLRWQPKRPLIHRITGAPTSAQVPSQDPSRLFSPAAWSGHKALPFHRPGARTVLTVSSSGGPGGEGTLQSVNRPGGRAGRKRGESCNRTRPLQPLTSKRAEAQHRPASILSQATSGSSLGILEV